MTIFPFIYGIAAGLCLYASLYHLLVGLRQRPFSRTHLSFSLMTLLVVVMIMFDAAYRLATTLDNIFLALDFGITVTAFVLIVFLWFVSNYTSVKPRLFLWIVSLGLAIVGILNLLLPSGILYAEITGFHIESMPWGEPFAIIEGIPSNLQIFNILLFLLTFGYCFFAIISQYRRGEKRASLFLLAGITPIILATIFDFLLDFNIIIDFIGLYAISYVGVVLIMSLVMSDEVVKNSILQREVAENERRMRSLLENVELVVVGLDANGHVNYTNPFYSKITNFSANEVLGKDFVQELIPSSLQADMQAILSEFMIADRHRYYQNPILTKDGSERIISWANVRLRDSDDQVIGTLSIGTDITEQLEAIQTLRTQATVLENMQEGVNVTNLSGDILFTNKAFDAMFGYEPAELIGQHVSILNELEEDDNQKLVDEIVQELESSQSWSGEFQNVRKGGTTFTTSAVISSLEINDTSYWVSVQTDISKRKQTEAELAQYREQLELLVDDRTADLSRAVTELDTLNHIALAVATLTDLQTILQSVCVIVAPLFDAAVVVVNVLKPERDAVHLMAGYDQEAENNIAPGVGEIIPLEITRMMQQVLHTNEPFSATNLQSKAETLSPLLVQRGIDALMIIPLRSRGEVIGLLGILRDALGTDFDQADINLAETISGYIAGAIENAQLTQQLAETAVAEERSRIARELHDSVTQNLYTVATISDAIPDLWDTHPKETREALENLRRLSRGALAEMRILLLELRPSSLLEKPLGQLLQQLGESVEGRSHIQVTTTITGNQSFPDNVQVALYRIVQEALNNVIKHSEATQVTIGLYQIANMVTLSVRDNGIGFDVETAVSGGFGLENMQERARQIDAKLSVDSMPDKGTEISTIWQTTEEDNHE